MTTSLTVISIIIFILIVAVFAYRRIPRIRKYNDMTIYDEAYRKKLKRKKSTQ